MNYTLRVFCMLSDTMNIFSLYLLAVFPGVGPTLSVGYNGDATEELKLFFINGSLASANKDITRCHFHETKVPIVILFQMES